MGVPGVHKESTRGGGMWRVARASVALFFHTCVFLLAE